MAISPKRSGRGRAATTLGDDPDSSWQTDQTGFDDKSCRRDHLHGKFPTACSEHALEQPREGNPVCRFQQAKQFGGFQFDRGTLREFSLSRKVWPGKM